MPASPRLAPASAPGAAPADAAAEATAVFELVRTRWPAVEQSLRRLLVVPVGSTE
jgi:hypothetical protein